MQLLTEESMCKTEDKFDKNKKNSNKMVQSEVEITWIDLKTVLTQPTRWEHHGRNDKVKRS